MTQPSTDHVLAVNNIEVIYNKVVQALRGLSLVVPRGQIVALLGSNGAGKSTTLKAVSGLLALEDGTLDAGTILFNGQSTAQHAPQQLVRAGLSHVMEGRRVFEDLTVEENLIAATYALTGRPHTAHGAPKPDFDLVYEYFPRLHERRKGLAGYLSGGEQQMLAIEVDAAAFDHAIFQRQQARDGLERGALARPVAAQQRHDLPTWHGQRQAAQGLHHLVVDDLDVVDFEDVGRGWLGHGNRRVRA